MTDIKREKVHVGVTVGDARYCVDGARSVVCPSTGFHTEIEPVATRRVVDEKL